MLKFLSLIFVAIVFFVSDAWSIVAQSARNAMSYRNVVKTTAATKPQPAAAPEAAEPEVRSINLKDAVSKNINGHGNNEYNPRRNKFSRRNVKLR